MGNNLSLLTAFFAGILSFASPCVLPLASSYLFFISGVNTEQLSQYKEKKEKKYTGHIVISTLFFIAGFSLVFIGMSVLLYGFIFFLGGLNRIVNSIAGAIVIVLGCNILFNFIPFLKYDDTGDRCMTCTPEHSILAAKEGSFLHPSSRKKGHIGSLLVGIAFGAGWTPCVGVFLGSILLLSSQSETFGLSLIYLVVYSLGLGVPFLITAVFWSTLIKQLYKFSRALPVIKIISGVFLILIGILMAFGRLTVLNAFFLKTGYALSQWAQTGGIGVRLIPGLVFFFLAAVPFAIQVLRKRVRFSIPLCVWSILFLILGFANTAGFLNTAAFISQWFVFSGI